MTHKFPTAAFLIIGNEILDGSTKDKNLPELISQLKEKGVLVKEVRVVRDEEAAMIAAIKQLSDSYDYVFTSGGIGPTHDDITTATVAKFFNKELVLDEESSKAMLAKYEAEGKDISYMNDYVMKMAYIPQDAKPIKNYVSGAPGFQIGNVYVLAGVPSIFKIMLEDALSHIPQGEVMHSVSMIVYAGESRIAADLEKAELELSAKHNLEIGSYPRRRETNGKPEYFVKVVVRCNDLQIAEATITNLQQEFAGRGLSCEKEQN